MKKCLELWKYQEPAEFRAKLLDHLEVFMGVITQTIQVTKKFKFSTEISKFSKPTKLRAFQKWSKKKFTHMFAIEALGSRLGSKDGGKSTKTWNRTRVSFDAHQPLSEEIIAGMKKVIASGISKEWIENEDFMLFLTLNEIFFYKEINKVEKRISQGLGKEFCKKFNDLKNEYINMDVSQGEGKDESLWGARGLGKNCDFLIDLRSRKSTNSNSMCQFSIDC